MGLDLVHGLVAGSVDANVSHRVLQGAAHVKFQRQVVDTLQRNEECNELSAKCCDCECQ